MDNLTVHYSQYFINKLRSKNIKIIYASPYSPETNPIELYFNTLK